MPIDFSVWLNAGLVGVLGLLVWKLPEILGAALGYLRERAATRDGEIRRREDARNAEYTSLFAAFRDELGKLRDAFQGGLTGMQQQWQAATEAIIQRMETLDANAAMTASRLEILDRHTLANKEHLIQLQAHLERLHVQYAGEAGPKPVAGDQRA